MSLVMLGLSVVLVLIVVALLASRRQAPRATAADVSPSLAVHSDHRSCGPGDGGGCDGGGGD